MICMHLYAKRIFMSRIRILFLTIFTLLFLVACGNGNDQNTTISGGIHNQQNQAIKTIANYAQDSTVEPTVEDYLDAGVTGVTSKNIMYINNEVAIHNYAEVDSTSEIQAIVDTVSMVCIEVITHAYNPDTLEERDFPTPCDVPHGWIEGNPTNSDSNTTDTNTSIYHYGKMGKYTVEITPYAKDNRSVIYHPKSWNTAPTPIIFFVTGWKNTDHNSYHTLLAFVASHGYSVIYIPDDGSYYSQFQKFDAIVRKYSSNLDTTKIGLLGHSSGGGVVFPLLKYMSAKGYGEDGRFICAMDPYIAQYMDKKDMQALMNTNVLIIQFGKNGKDEGNDTDPRIVLTIYNLLTGEGIDKNYIVLNGPNDASHGYPARQDIDKMQGLLKPLDALMEYTFTLKSDAHHSMALEGEGKENPTMNAYQKVLPIEDYKYSCTYANKYHKGSDGKTKSTIDNCGEPRIEAN